MSITRVDVKPGDLIAIRLPWSEACLFMGVADKVMPVRVLSYGAQILNDDGTEFSFPILHGEAGIYTDARSMYVTVEKE